MSRARMDRIDWVLRRRQQDLTVIMENVHKPHNLAAIARSCDAVGGASVHAVGPEPSAGLTQKSASGVGKWVELRHHSTLDTAFADCRSQGMQMIAVSITESSRDFRQLDYTPPTAFVVGAELDGLSKRAQTMCDEVAHIPMFGMVESLNVSVATALFLFEARRQREQIGAFELPGLSEAVRAEMTFEWAQPVIAEYCRRHKLSYPALDECGDVIDWDMPRNEAIDDGKSS